MRPEGLRALGRGRITRIEGLGDSSASAENGSSNSGSFLAATNIRMYAE